MVKIVLVDELRLSNTLGGNFTLATYIFCFSWDKILSQYGEHTLKKIRDHYAASEQYEICADIQQHL